MEFVTINPYNGKEIDRHREQNAGEVASILDRSAGAFDRWRRLTFSERALHIRRLGELLEERIEACAAMMTKEMGKPIRQSRAELRKCRTLCDFYANHSEKLLEPQEIATEAGMSLVRSDPVGTVFGIMPWNFPYWQVMRYSVPSLMAGNTVLLKHAPGVFGCAKKIGALFGEAGFPEVVFQNLFIHHDRVEEVISHNAVSAVTLTGSERAGSNAAMLAGKHLKKSVLELGGSNAFVVLADADLEKTVPMAVKARMMNAGQSCIAAKRIIVEEPLFDRFLEMFVEETEQLRSGDPMSDETDIGPLARVDLAERLESQVRESMEAGAVLLLGGARKEAYFEPTILTEVRPGMPVFDQETFGPVAVIIRARNEEQAWKLAAETSYGLGLTVCTGDVEHVLERAPDISDGAFFVNTPVKSDPRLPFGGTGRSGYGRELSRDGILEFVNRKTVYVK